MTISFSRLGQHGRLANQLFQIASTMGIAAANSAQAAFPEWKYEQYFDFELPHGEMPTKEIRVEEFFDFNPVRADVNIDLVGYFQSWRYFPANWRHNFKFKPEFLNTVADKANRVTAQNCIVIHIRRGDYVSNPNYYQLPITYYLLALLSIPDWHTYKIVIISDDLPYCKVHFECLGEKVFFADGFDEIESMALATLCDHFILSNSSFSWWCAYMGGGPLSIKIHPGHYFTGPLAGNSTKDFWPAEWTEFKKDNYRLPLKNLTFTIPVYYDHKDRKNNLDLSVCMLQNDLDTNIIVGEQGGKRFEYMAQYCNYTLFDKMQHFHRTRMLNQMAMQATTPYVANWDCDVVIPPMQIYMAVAKLQQGADMVFPYDGRFARLPREQWFRRLQSRLDVGVVGDTDLRGKHGRAVPETSVGGAVFFNKAAFIAGGMENENMISFGPEDCERNDRFTALGYFIERVGGALYHIDHWCGPDSSRRNPYFKANHKELDKVRGLDADGLRLYINTWGWRPVDLKAEEVMAILERYCQWAEQVTGIKYQVATVIKNIKLTEVSVLDDGEHGIGFIY